MWSSTGPSPLQGPGSLRQPDAAPPTSYPHQNKVRAREGAGLVILLGAEAAGSQRPLEGKELLKAMGKETGEVGRMKGIQNTKR